MQFALALKITSGSRRTASRRATLNLWGWQRTPSLSMGAALLHPKRLAAFSASKSDRSVACKVCFWPKAVMADAKSRPAAVGGLF
jgi:hypothetical protein